jgi:serine/threonine-protein kinase
MLSALEYIHNEGMVHRDFNPSNIICRHGGDIVVIDFGTVRVAGMSGTVVGKGEFSIPELASRGFADRRSDIYGAGGILLYMLTGKTPAGLGRPDILGYLVDNGISQKTAKCIDQALQVDPDKRFSSALAMRRALGI